MNNKSQADLDADQIMAGETWGAYRERELAELMLKIGYAWDEIEAAFPKHLRWFAKLLRWIHRVPR